jgi:hypothetical protein
MDPPASLGNLVRLLPLQLSELPAHPALTKIDQNTEAINRGAQNHINETYLDGNNSSQRIPMTLTGNSHLTMVAFHRFSSSERSNIY